jgi:hypothetical protein
MQYKITGKIEYDGAIVTVDVINRDIRDKLTVNAMLDTGAVRSLVRYSKVLQPLAVPRINSGAQLSFHQSGEHEQVETYQVEIGMHFPQGVYPWENVTVIARDLLDAPYDVVVGRDMLERCLFTYDGRKQRFELVIEN